MQYMEQVKKMMGEYGKPMMVGEYKQVRMMLQLQDHRVG